MKIDNLFSSYKKVKLIMGRNTKVTQEDVDRIANALTAANKEPTLSAIKDQLGSGSFSTIGPMLKIWKDAKKEKVDVPPIPGVLEDIALNAAASCWEEAFKETSKQIQAMKDLHAAEKVEEKKEMEKILLAMDELEGKLYRKTESEGHYKLKHLQAEQSEAKAQGRIVELEKIIKKLEQKPKPTKRTKPVKTEGSEKSIVPEQHPDNPPTPVIKPKTSAKPKTKTKKKPAQKDIFLDNHIKQLTDKMPSPQAFIQLWQKNAHIDKNGELTISGKEATDDEKKNLIKWLEEELAAETA
ncbi:MAG: DNA-binding protein [Magnetococcales bacterium]|nr:DNA-binding protein [Magnetococcales bacterium]